MPDVKAWVRRTLQDPIAWTDVVQLVKTVIAAVIAWILAAQVFDLPQAFLAPWAALLVVHSTIYRTFRAEPNRSRPRCSASCSPGRQETCSASTRLRSR